MRKVHICPGKEVIGIWNLLCAEKDMSCILRQANGGQGQGTEMLAAEWVVWCVQK